MIYLALVGAMLAIGAAAWSIRQARAAEEMQRDIERRLDRMEEEDATRNRMRTPQLGPNHRQVNGLWHPK